MRILQVFGLCLVCLFCAFHAALAHEDRLGPVVVVEKVYGASKPLGHIVGRYDATNMAKPIFHLRCNLFHAELSAKALLDLPRPNWDQFFMPYSYTSFDPKTRKIVKRPYIMVSVPLWGPLGQSWTRTRVEFHFDDKGKLLNRRLHRFVPTKNSNTIETVDANWPVGSKETAAQVLARGMKKLESS